ncbi:NADH-quinone oxidoreductase subunit J [bacterium]|nr:NADH-quinone oxidoreductase subunit J [bacterium]
MSFLDFFVVFCFLGGVVCSAVVALHPNILYAAVALIGSLLAVAGVYASLGADFLAAAQLIIYVGGVIVVILFAVMMSESIYKRRFLDGVKKMFLPTILSIALMLGMFKLLVSTNWGELRIPNYENTTIRIGQALTGPYALIFEYVAIVLLFGLIGAIVVARPNILKKDQDGGNS